MMIGIKVGSSILTEPGNGIRPGMIETICEQIADLRQDGHDVFLVTSGAVASDPDKLRDNSIRAAVGMGRLICRYIDCFDERKVEIAQVLLTDRDFEPESIKHLRRFFKSTFSHKIVPIVNANDVVDWKELNRLAICADNDWMFCNLCQVLRPDYAIIGFDQDGVLDGEGKVISEVSEGNYRQVMVVCRQTAGSSGHGEFGMQTKVDVLRQLSLLGIGTLLANGHAEEFILKAVSELQGNPLGFGTRFKFDPQAAK